MTIIISEDTDKAVEERKMLMTETVPKFTLKALRVNKKKMQQEIADYLEVNLRTYQKYEKDPDIMSLGNAKKLAKYYGISLDLLS